MDIQSMHLDEFQQIQPHGVLLVLNKNLQVIQHSENIAKLMEIPIHQIAVTPIANFLMPEDSKDNILSWLANANNQYKKLFWRTKQNKMPIWTYIQQKKDYIILEIEPIQETQLNQDGLFNLSQYVFEDSKEPTSLSLQHVLQKTCDEIRKITDYDRVNIFQVNPSDENTYIITGEAVKKGMPSFINLHFHSDQLSATLKQRFLALPIQYTPNIRANPIHIIPTIPSENTHVIDLSHCHLSVMAQDNAEKILLMGAQATLSIAIIYENKLWGFISCQHKEPKYISINSRLILILIANTLAKQIVALERIKHSENEYRITKLQASLLQKVTKQNSFMFSLDNSHLEIMELLFATGMSVYFQGNLFNYGKTPDNQDVIHLITWLKKNKLSQVITSSLPSLYPDSIKYKDNACGLLALPLNAMEDNYILFYRPELIYSIPWADASNDAATLQTRFETITQQSLAWSTYDEKSAEFVRTTMVKKQLHDLLKIKALHDPLTDLLNHIYLNEQLKIEILRASRDGQPITLMHLHLDSFRQITTELGQQAGNIALSSVARLLKSYFRGYDFIYHNNEEFMIILSGMTNKTATDRANTLQQSINTMKIEFNNTLIPSLSVSTGIATYPEHGKDDLTLTNAARNALALAMQNDTMKIISPTVTSGP